MMPQALKPRSARRCDDEKAVSRRLTYSKWNLSSRGQADPSKEEAGDGK